MTKLEAHERLRIARRRRYKTAREASEALGVPYGTYTGHEAGSRGFAEDVERYARAFRVRAAWLAFEDGAMEPGVQEALLSPEDQEIVDLVHRLPEAERQAYLALLRSRYAAEAEEQLPYAERD